MEIDIPYIIVHKKKKLSSKDCEDYWYLSGPIAIIAILFIAFFREKNENSSGFHTSLFIFHWLIGLGLSLSFLFLVLKRLKQNSSFTCIQTPYSKDQNQKIIVNIYRQVKRGALDEYSDHITFEYFVSPFSWGEAVTIIPLDNEILINSHPIGGNIITLWEDAANVRYFKKELAKRL